MGIMLPSSWFVRGFVGFMSASKRFVWGLCYHQINGKSVGAYRIRPSHWRKSMFDGGDVLGDIIPFSPTWGRMRYAPTPVRLLSWLNTINHYHCSIEFWAVLVCASVPFSPTSGRMRYAPTPVRLWSWLNMVIHSPCSVIIGGWLGVNMAPKL